MKLYGFPLSPGTCKVLAVAHHLGIELDFVLVDLQKGEQMRPEYLAINRNHQTPTLVDGDLALWESNAIMHYLAGKKPGNPLWPADARAQADILRWQFWMAINLGTACQVLIYERVVKKAFMNGGAPDPQACGAAEQKFKRFAAVLDEHLQGRQWLVGDGLTLADYTIAAELSLRDLGEFPVSEYREIQRWLSAVEAQPAWRKAAPGTM